MGAVVDLDIRDPALAERLTSNACQAFKEISPDWVPTVELAREKVLEAGKSERFVSVWISEERAIGWVGVMKRRCLWEINQIAEAVKHHFSGETRSIPSRCGAGSCW